MIGLRAHRPGQHGQTARTRPRCETGRKVTNITSDKIGSRHPKCKTAPCNAPPSSLALLRHHQTSHRLRHVPGKPAHCHGVEGHDSSRSIRMLCQIAGYRCTKGRDMAARDLQFNQQRDRLPACLQQRLQPWDGATISQLHLLKAFGPMVRQQPLDTSHSQEGGVVKDHRDAIPAQPDIAFDAIALRNGRAKSGHAIFADARPMQPAMGEGAGGQEGKIRPPTGQGRPRRSQPRRPTAAPARPPRCGRACLPRRKPRPSVPTRHWPPWVDR